MPVLAGANMIYGPGMLDAGMTLNFGQLVIDNEFIKMIKHAAQGIPVNDYNLAADVIKSVGPRGHYLMEQHTMENLHTQSDTTLFDRQTREDWTAQGCKTVNGKAIEVAKNILENYEPAPLPAGAQEKIDDILKEATKRYAK